MLANKLTWTGHRDQASDQLLTGAVPVQTPPCNKHEDSDENFAIQGPLQVFPFGREGVYCLRVTPRKNGGEVGVVVSQSNVTTIYLCFWK